MSASRSQILRPPPRRWSTLGHASGTRGKAVLLSRALAAGCPLSPSIAANALLGAQQTVGNDAVGHLVKTRSDLRRTLARKPDSLAEERQRELVEFRRKKYYRGVEEFTNGFFQAVYAPLLDLFMATVRVRFDFIDSETQDPFDLHDPHPQVHKTMRYWTSQEKEDWRKQFHEVVEKAWSVHWLECHKPGWESLVARVAVDVEEIGDGPTMPTAGIFDVKVYRGDIAGQGSPAVGHRQAWFGYDNVQSKPGERPVVVHEFGHMLGLDDEYRAAGKPEWASHSDMVQAEFGYGVPRLDSGNREDRFKNSIMNSGVTGKVLPEHGVVFLDAIRRITGIPEWKLRRGVPN